MSNKSQQSVLEKMRRHDLTDQFDRLRDHLGMKTRSMTRSKVLKLAVDEMKKVNNLKMELIRLSNVITILTSYMIHN